jgi:hypothetical protein
MLSSIIDSKHFPLSRRQVCQMVIKILTLLCATVQPVSAPQDDGATGNNSLTQQLQMKQIGVIIEYPRHSVENQKLQQVQQEEEEEDDVSLFDPSYPFALPPPARDSLLCAAISLLSTHWFIRTTSLQMCFSLFTPDEKKSVLPSDKVFLLIPWKPLLQLFLRTSPMLNERNDDGYPTMSRVRKNSIVIKTTKLIEYCRYFFDQQDLFSYPLTRNSATTIQINLAMGISRIPIVDTSAKQIWDLVQYDLTNRKYTNADFRALVILHSFLPTVCSANFYLKILPVWIECWLSVDKCNDMDFLWINLFCRARKYTPPNIGVWAMVRRKLLSQCGYWLQIPVTGASNDRSFPNISPLKPKGVPAFLRTLAGSNSSYQEGIDFVENLATLLVFCIGKYDDYPHLQQLEGSSSKDISDVASSSAVSDGSSDIIRFLSYVGPYFNPTNNGPWTFPLGLMLNFFCTQFSRRIGVEVGQMALATSHPSIAQDYCFFEPYLNDKIPNNEIPIIIDALLPLCHQSTYSKSSYVGKAGEAGLLSLIQIAPKYMAPYFLDFAATALDVSSINLSHQAPSALGVLDRLLQPSLRRNPSMILQRLPQILSLTLLGIDSNDRRKTIATLTFYHSVTSWLSIGSVVSNKCSEQKLPESCNAVEFHDGTVRLQDNLMDYIERVEKSNEFRQAVGNLSEGTYLQSADARAPDIENSEKEQYVKELFEETALSMGDWALAFLDRVYHLLRAAGMQEKVNKNHLGASVRHTTSDAQQSKSFSRLLTVCLVSLFSAMDNKIYQKAVHSVCRFLGTETLPFAAKDSSSLCKAIVVAKDDGFGVNTLVPVLTRDLSKMSIVVATYRVRCLSGAMKHAGVHLLSFREAVVSSIEFALSVNDDGEQKQLFKAGCKLLKHTLSSQVEAVPLHANFHHQTSPSGKSAVLHENPIHWESPTGTQLDFALELLEQVAFIRLRNLFSHKASFDSGIVLSKDETLSTKYEIFGEQNGQVDEVLQKCFISEWRASLKILKYSLRGVVGVLFDQGLDFTDIEGVQIYPNGFHALISPSSQSSKDMLQGLRGKLCTLITFIIGGISHETFVQTSKGNSYDTSYVISSDTKICKEISEIANILLTRRGAHTKGWQARAGQQESLQDAVLSGEANHISSALERASVWESNESFLYGDGEDGGKVMPRNLLVYKVWSFYLEAQRSASYEIPRALHKERVKDASIGENKQILFSMHKSFHEIREGALALLNWSDRSQKIHAIDAYEGLIDGLMALSCHPKLHVRSGAIGALESGLSRFSFFVRPRIPRLLEAIQLLDEESHGKYGVPSCFKLSSLTDADGKKKQLADVIKGICAIISTSRVIKRALASEAARLQLIQTLCGTQQLLSLLPREELHKTLHFFQVIFNRFRSQWYTLPMLTDAERMLHRQSINFLLSQLAGTNRYVVDDKGLESENLNVTTDSNLIHWRNQLLIGWFLTNITIPDDTGDKFLGWKLWTTAFHLVEKNMGQPIQRVALGLLGRLTTFVRSHRGKIPGQEQCVTLVKEKLLDENICRTLCLSLAFNHRQDTETGGGSRAQWSAGIEDIIYDAGSNLSPAIFFPFSKDQLASRIFKVQHAQLVQSLLFLVDYEDALLASKNLFVIMRELSLAPPNEDQKNKQTVVWEIFGGILRGLIFHTSRGSRIDVIWNSILAFLDEVLPGLTIDMSCAVCDAIRFGIYGLPATDFHELILWISSKLENSLWQIVPFDSKIFSDLQQSTGGSCENGADELIADTKSTLDGFASQSKWLHILSAILIEIRDYSPFSLFLSPLSQINGQVRRLRTDDGGDSVVYEVILPRLLKAVGHPYDRCRDRIAGCLYRICQIEDSTSDGEKTVKDSVLEVFLMNELEAYNFKEKLSLLITTRKFMTYSLHKGEVRYDYPNYVVPLLPILFTTLKSAEDEGTVSEITSSDRALEAEVAKDSRHMLSAIGSCQITYSKNDIEGVLSTLSELSKHSTWQIRQAVAHFLRCFHGCHKFIFSEVEMNETARVVTNLLSDDRREVSSAAMAALTGILAVTSSLSVSRLVNGQVEVARRSIGKKKKKGIEAPLDDSKREKEKKRLKNQQSSVFFLCAVVLSRPYDTPPFVPVALEALSKHSYESRAPLTVRETVKKCFSEFKRTHMTDNWELHRKKFTQEQLEALEDVVSTPHYYA